MCVSHATHREAQIVWCGDLHDAWDFTVCGVQQGSSYVPLCVCDLHVALICAAVDFTPFLAGEGCSGASLPF